MPGHTHLTARQPYIETTVMTQDTNHLNHAQVSPIRKTLHGSPYESESSLATEL